MKGLTEGQKIGFKAIEEAKGMKCVELSTS
jgi:cold shock CspA family protein